MGKRDSSKTRVVPVFDDLLKSDPTGNRWIPKLVSLPTGGYPISLHSGLDFSIGEACWGVQEKKLAPPSSLLSWLITHPRWPSDNRLSSDPIKAQKRRELIEGSICRRDEALSLLENNPGGEDWHVFEGETQPDVFICTPDILIVIEGKRTEAGTTKKTKWMPGRHQMLRHLDCAWEARGNRSVVGFLIVEGIGTSPVVPDFWLNEARITIADEAIKTSLPHRTVADQKQIARSFLGVTTWQRVCAEFAIEWLRLPDQVED